MATLSPIVILIIKIGLIGLAAIFVVAALVLMAAALVLMAQALRTGALPANDNGVAWTRRQNPIRFWLRVANHTVFLAALAVMIYAITTRIGSP